MTRQGGELRRVATYGVHGPVLRRHRHAHRFGDFGLLEPPEESHFDDPHGARVDLLECRECLIQGEHVFISAHADVIRCTE